jgi:hypothetical protein
MFTAFRAHRGRGKTFLTHVFRFYIFLCKIVRSCRETTQCVDRGGSVAGCRHRLLVERARAWTMATSCRLIPERWRGNT